MILSRNIKKIKRFGIHLLKGEKANVGNFERFDYKYEPNTVMTSDWVAHYFIYKKFLQRAECVPSLDLCCGSGAGTILIANTLNVNVVGIDYSDDAIKYSQNFNTTQLTQYHKLDLNKKDDLQTLKDIIVSNKILQVFFIEGIEHLRVPNDLIEILLKNGVKRIFISTPYEKEDTIPSGYHTYPFTTSIYYNFSKRFNAKILCYCKYVDKEKIKSLLKDRLEENQIIEQQFTNSTSDALNYLIEIQA